MKEVGGRSIQFCGGCGAAFLVDPGVTVRPQVIDGVARVYCACCLEFLGVRVPAPELATTPGYDDEGQRINVHSRGETPTTRRRFRDAWAQVLLSAVATSGARHRLPRPRPLFVES